MKRLASVVAIVTCGFIASAQAITIQLDTTALTPNLLTPLPPSMFAPGQALDMAEIGVGPTATSFTSITDCLLMLSGCTQSIGSVSTLVDTAYSNGFVATTAAIAGGDVATVAATIQCPATCSSNAFVNAQALDLQQFIISDGTGTLGNSVDIDVTFSLAAFFENNSSPPAAANQLVFGAGSQLWIGDPATFSQSPLSYGRLSAPFMAAAVATTSSSSDVALDTVQTVSLEINKPYWLGLVAGYSLGLTAGDYTGFNATMGGFVDPTFAVNADWVAANPDLAPRITIERTLNAPAAVPEPSSVALLGAGLAVLLNATRRRGRLIVKA